jgi:uncharacterized surface protein with fasciclin (FAS1) repeats
MKSILSVSVIIFCSVFISCNNEGQTTSADPRSSPALSAAGQSGVQDENSQKNVVQVAISSKDHTTLVKAVQAAELADALSNAGPFTVFAPTNAAFDQLPAGTVENLLKTENIPALTDILQYHVSLGVYKTESLTDGQVIGQVNGGNITIIKKDGKILINGTAAIVGTVPASNGVVYVVDQVLLPAVTK